MHVQYRCLHRACDARKPFEGQLTLGINTLGLYINKGGSLLFAITNIPAFFLLFPEGYTFTFKSR